MDAFKNGERIVHPAFGTGTVLNIEEKGSLKIAFDTVGEKRINPRYGRLTSLTPAEEALRRQEEIEWLETFFFENERAEHHLGGHWHPFFDDALAIIKQLPEILPKSLLQVACADNQKLPRHPIPSLWPEGIHLAWPLRTHGLMVTLKISEDGPSEFVSLYPSMVTGSQHRVRIDRVFVWNGGLEAQIEGNIAEMQVTFFDTLYASNRCFYEMGRLCEFILTGIAYHCQRAGDRIFEINDPKIVRILNKDFPDQKGRKTVPVHTKGMAALIPLEEGDRDEYTFHGSVKDVEEITILDRPGWVCKTTVLRAMEPEMDIDLRIVITRRVWEEIEPPEVGEDIEGSLWLQGYLWYPKPV